MFKWNRYGQGYEVSSQSDRRFSAFGAYLDDKRSIEEHYQCDVKGYDPGGKNWRLGKGKPPLKHYSPEALYEAYLSLWKQWAKTHPDLMDELRQHAQTHEHTLLDRFATSPINQARALSDILNESV